MYTDKDLFGLYFFSFFTPFHGRIEKTTKSSLLLWDLSAGSSRHDRWERRSRSSMTSTTAVWHNSIDALPPVRDLFIRNTNKNKLSSTLLFFFFSYPDNHPPPLLFYLFISLPCETTSQIIILSSANLLYPDSCVRETLPGSTAVSIDGASSNDVVLLTRNKWKPREGAGQDGWGPSVSPNVYFIRVVCIPCFFLLCYTQSS